MFSRRVLASMISFLAVGSFAVVPGCDWFQSSDPAQRSSPVISSLSVQPSSVLCAQEFTVMFHYEDPQGDITNARMTLQLSGSEKTREETPLWPETISRGSGTVSFVLTFPSPCTDEGGVWVISVQAEDERGHTSNTLTSQITLTTAG